MLIRHGVTAVIAVAGVMGAAAGPGAVAPASAATLAGARAARSLPSGAAAQFVKDILGAWEITKGSGVTVAVLSTGVDPGVPGLAGKVTTGPDYVGLRHPQKLAGTLAASMIAGSGPSSIASIASAGIAPEARILSVRTDPDSMESGSAGFFRNSNFIDISARAIRYAVNHGAQVIYVELSTQATPDTALESAVSYAISKDVVIVATDEAFGDPADAYSYPPALPGVIGAGSVDVSGLLPAQFDKTRSARNDSVLVSAPGNSLPELGPGGQLGAIDGSWAAAAWVTAAAALIKSVYPHLSPALVGRALALSARYRPRGGYNTAAGFGLINPAGALAEAGQLAKLTAAAPAGAAAVSPAATFGSGPPPGVIEAVNHSRVELAGLSAAIAAGLACLIGAFLLLRRRAARGAQGAPVEAPWDVTGAFGA
jgi:Subtilase family